MASSDPIVIERKPGQESAPKLALEVNGYPALNDITDNIAGIEWEHSLEMASMLTLYVNNPGFASLLRDTDLQQRREDLAKHHGFIDAQHDFVSHTIFQPGNEVVCKLGYGEFANVEVGRAIIDRHMPIFPRDGVPTLTVKGYDKSKFMMGVQGAITGIKQNIIRRQNKADAQRTRDPKINVRGGRSGGNKLVQSKTHEGEPYTKKTHSDIAILFADKYGFYTDIEETKRKDNLIQRKGENDYDFLKKLAHINSFLFWVDYSSDNEIGKPGWTLHFKSPKDRGGKIEPAYVFRYREGGQGTLLEFMPEYGLDDKASEIIVSGIDSATGEPIALVELEQRPGPRAQWVWRIGGGRMARAKSYDETARTNPKRRTKPRDLGSLGGKGAQQRENLRATTGGTGRDAEVRARGTLSDAQRREIHEARARAKNRALVMSTLKNASQFQLTVGGVKFAFPYTRGFTADENGLAKLAELARRWVFAHRDAFVIGRGRIIGIETVRADQVHEIRGTGPRLDGFWYFIEAKHVWRENAPYEIEFVARKILQ